MPSARLVGWWVGCAASGFASHCVVSAIDAAEAGAGAVDAVVLPTPGTEAWWQAAVREAVYALCERSSTCGNRQLDSSVEKARRPSALPAA